MTGTGRNDRGRSSQLDALRRFAQEHGHELVDAYVCVDDGYSGTRLDRPGLDRLRDGAEAGAFEAVLILCPDRLARKYAYQMLILEEFERFGVRVIFLEQPPSEDPHARLLVQIQGAIAEYERMKITERYRAREALPSPNGGVDLGMPGLRLYILHGLPLAEHQGGIRVARILDAKAPKLGFLEDPGPDPLLKSKQSQ